MRLMITQCFAERHESSGERQDVQHQEDQRKSVNLVHGESGCMALLASSRLVLPAQYLVRRAYGVRGEDLSCGRIQMNAGVLARGIDPYNVNLVPPVAHTP